MQKGQIKNKSVEQLLVEIESLKQQLLDRENEKSDLEILLETTTEHSTNIEAELHNTNEQMSRYLQQVYSITNAAAAVEAGTFQSHTLDEVANRSDELGRLARVFQRMTEQIKTREEKLKQQVEQLRIEIEINQRLNAENSSMAAKLEVTRELQQMLLPKEQELRQIAGLEISGFMEPADEMGGDYYDVLNHEGLVKIGIGDVSGHGLESGVLMLMVQTAVRTLLTSNETDSTKFLNVLNRTIYDNVQRMRSDKNVTLALLDYQEGRLRLSGQHEEMIVVRSGGHLEQIDTIDLGFPLGLQADIAVFVAQTEVQLHPGDVVVLYTDGIIEAEDILGRQYGLKRLCELVKLNWRRSADKIKQTVIDDVKGHIGKQKVYDDITMLVLKQK
ncbi:SpoIIE family protein phosphatase [Nostoc sp. CHAB 5836]|uniref:PP2C family protein-serine/threonine phosphatase n=1 Tax=Nostoc sp. CHAB 5836 TaxID=2780404 RepID=UPI001E396E9D|nr:SpoIIE family protein phosphatase [Nostoc sp. CHAB 5836]MCC5618429.1 SpoIIE family protein phosphatase [Nostoc sp. CHAB 5836]